MRARASHRTDKHTHEAGYGDGFGRMISKELHAAFIDAISMQSVFRVNAGQRCLVPAVCSQHMQVHVGCMVMLRAWSHASGAYGCTEQTT